MAPLLPPADLHFEVLRGENLVGDGSLSPLHAKRPVVEDPLVVKALNGSRRILDFLEKNVGETLGVVCHGVLDDLDVDDVAVLAENAPQVLLVDPPRDAGDIDVVAYREIQDAKSLPGFSTCVKMRRPSGSGDCSLW